MLTKAQQKLRYIRQTVRGIGTQPPVINAVDMLCDLVEELMDNVPVPVPEVQEDVPPVPADTDLSKPKLPESKGKTKRTADKAKPNKTKKATGV